MTLDEIKDKQERCIAGNTTPVFIDDLFGERIVCNKSPYNDNKEDNKQIEFCREHNMNYEHSIWDGTINCIRIK